MADVQFKLCPQCGYGEIIMVDDVYICDHCQSEFDEEDLPDE